MGGAEAYETRGGSPKGKPVVGVRMRTKKMIRGSGIVCVPEVVFPAGTP